MPLTLDVLLEVLRKVLELPVAARTLLLEVLGGANLEEENPRMLRVIAPTLRELDDQIDGAAALADDIDAVVGEAGETDSDLGGLDMAPKKTKDGSEEEAELQNLLDEDDGDLDDDSDEDATEPEPKPKASGRKSAKAKTAKPKAEKPKAEKGAKAAKPKRPTKPAEGVITDRKLTAGTVLTATFKGTIHTLKVLVAKDGKQTYKAHDGTVFNSPSAAGGVITGIACSGWVFWRLAPKGTKLTSPKKVAAGPKAGKPKPAAKPKASKPKGSKKSKKSRRAKS